MSLISHENGGFSSSIFELDLVGNKKPDAFLAAFTIKHGLSIIFADSDCEHFTDEVKWINPLSKPKSR